MSHERWLAAGICLSRIEPVDADLVTRALPWLTATLSELGALPPPGCVIDVALLLSGAPLDTTHASVIEAPRLRDAIGRYEDRVLGRLAAERRLVSVRDAFALLDERLQPMAVAVLAVSLASKSRVLEPVEPGLLRKARRLRPDDLIAQGFEAWREEPEVFLRLADGYDALADMARSEGTLLTDADVFTLENLSVLGEMGQRVAIAQIVDAAEAMAKTWPRRIKVERREHGSASTNLEDESTYPVGGLSSVATHGAFENLVTSELVYMDGPSERQGTVDLFDVRYAEGELLYYTRDEALIVRPHRLIAFIMQPSLAAARLKDAGVRWQRVVVTLGWLLASVRRLELWLGDTELRFLCVIERDERHLGALAHEEQLVSLLLTEWQDKGAAEVVVMSQEQWKARLARDAQLADVRAVILGVDSETAAEGPVLTVPLDAHARDWDTWCQDGLAILCSLV